MSPGHFASFFVTSNKLIMHNQVANIVLSCEFLSKWLSQAVMFKVVSDFAFWVKLTRTKFNFTNYHINCVFLIIDWNYWFNKIFDYFKKQKCKINFEIAIMIMITIMITTYFPFDFEFFLFFSFHWSLDTRS